MANEKAKCACDAVLNRKKGATTGLRKHLLQGHKRQAFGVTSTKPLSKSCQLSTEQQKNFDSLTIKFIIEDGRNFTDMNKSGVLKVFDHLVEGYVPPHRYTVQRTLKRLESEYEASSINELSIVQSNIFEKTRSVTTDGVANMLKAAGMLDVVPAISNNADEIDSNEEDSADDIQIVP
ncbi:unnamed protein product [Adineta ricciae]|uniref:Uncharacterized protein n=1 Tax=Adineta ricciae TaxID=249248 RepID=A0A815RJL2_ADIRI|nr:unnamed protein product [Adineta ricciae]